MGSGADLRGVERGRLLKKWQVSSLDLIHRIAQPVGLALEDSHAREDEVLSPMLARLINIQEIQAGAPQKKRDQEAEAYGHMQSVPS